MVLLRNKTLNNPVLWDALVFTRTSGAKDSVIDIAPYNSKGSQSFRTLLSAKLGTQRFMLPLDGHLRPLPQNPITVLRGFASILNHPDRRHDHKYYTINIPDFQLCEGIMKSATGPSPSLPANSGFRVRTDVSAELGNTYFSYSLLRVPRFWTPPTDVDYNDVYALLRSFPMLKDGVKQTYIILVSKFFAFS